MALLVVDENQWPTLLLTMGGALASAILYNLRSRIFSSHAAPPHTNMQPSGVVTIDEMPDDNEAMRDFARAYLASAVLLLRADNATLLPACAPHQPHHGERGALDSARCDECRDALVASLEQGGQLPLAESAAKKLVRMLSVSPAVALLIATGCPPTLQQHRFVVLHGAGQLRVLTVGFLPDMRTGKPAWLLVMASSDLSAPAPRAGAELTVSYSVRPVRASATIESELARETPQILREFA